MTGVLLRAPAVLLVAFLAWAVWVQVAAWRGWDIDPAPEVRVMARGGLLDGRGAYSQHAGAAGVRWLLVSPGKASHGRPAATIRSGIAQR